MENLLIGSARHLELEGGLRDLEYLMLNLPYVCNYKCSKCCNASRENPTGQPLSFKEIKMLITEAKEIGMRVLVIAGEGEPFLDNNIRGIIQQASDTNLISYIFTNGSMLDRDTAKFLKENGASLVINIDSLGKSLYEELTGVKGSFSKVFDNVQGIREQFKDTYSQIAEYSLRRVAINTVVSHRNQGELPRIREFCGDDFVFVCNTPMDIGRARGNAQFLGAISNSDTIPLGTTSDNIWCAYMRNGISVGSNGDILMCAYSLESAGKLGNIRDGGLKKYTDTAKSVFDTFFCEEQPAFEACYGNVNHPRCILRYPQYDKFIQRISVKNENRNKSSS